MKNIRQQGTIKPKNGRKTAAVCVLAFALLSGCGKAGGSEGEMEIQLVEAEDLPVKNETQEPVAAPEQAQATEQTDRPETAEENEEETDNDRKQARLQKYQAVLTDVLEKQIYPDGTDCGYDGFYPLSDNRFAVFDVDKDGSEELILCFTTSSMAGMRETVYDYDEETDSVIEEYSGFPGVVYYEGGLLEERLSHNQGMAPMGDFWPYFVYHYEPETDTYQSIYMVDGWEKEYRAEDYDGNPYPEEVDAGKDGIVFLIMEGDYDMSSATILGKSDYEKWREEQGLNGAKIMVSFQELTAENIGIIY